MSDESDRDEKEQAKAAALARALELHADDAHADAPAEEAADEDTAELVELARSLRAAEMPQDLAKEDHDAIISKVLSSRAATAPKPQQKGGGRVIRVAFGVTATLALAAAILLYVGRQKPQEQVAEYARSRSTTPLFSEPFKSGAGAARIDRIASSRERDYRENLFAMRGVR